MANRTCTVSDCGRIAKGSRGWCVAHYTRWRRTGDVRAHVPIRDKAPNGAGTISSNGYRKIMLDGRVRGEHRIVMEQLLGRPLHDFETVHHINGIRDDNRPD